jgi:glycosyltransferase involved in cell wall biosynthesis
VRLVKEILYPRLLRSFDGFCYVGQRNYEYLRHYGLPEDRLFFSPHCVDNDAFAAAASRGARPRDDAGAKSVLFAGKLVGRKRPVDLIRALALAAQAGCLTQAVFAGSGELEGELRREAAQAGVPTQFLGFQNQSRMPSVYAAADLLVLPSDHLETWGLVVNEAMACGTPAVVSDAVGCGPDLIEPGRTGAVFPLGDIPALAAAVRSILAMDRTGLRRDLARKVSAYSPAAAAHGILQCAGELCRSYATG